MRETTEASARWLSVSAKDYERFEFRIKKALQEKLNQRRLETATTVLSGILACTRDYTGASDQTARVRMAVEYADELLSQLGMDKS